MERSRVVALVVGVLLTLLFITVATAPPARIATRQPSLPWELPTIDLAPLTPTTTLADGLAGDDQDLEPSRSWELFTSFLQLALLAAAFVGAVRLLLRAWANRPRLRWTRRTGTPDFMVLDDLAEAVTADAEAQRAALRTGTARNAIVECWLRLEAIVEDAGIDHDPALTATEFTAQVLARLDVDPAPTQRLTALYREARFSTHDMGETHRRAAIDAVDAIHASLRTVGAVTA